MSTERQPLHAVVRFVRAHWPKIAVASLLLFFAILKLYCLNFVLGDEHMYFYMSLLVSRGAWPYRDFFFSHPPLQLYLMAPLYIVFGYALPLSKAVPNIAAIVSGFHVYLLGRRLLGEVEGVLATALFLFTFDVLRGSSHFTGANCALAFGLAGAYQVFARRPILAGILFTIGTFIGVYVAPLALMLIVLLLLRSWKESLRLFLSYSVGCALLCAVFAGVAGPAFWYDVFIYNLNKAPMAYSWFDKFRNVFYLNTSVMLGFLPALFWAGAMWAVRGRAQAPTNADSSALQSLISRLNLWAEDDPVAAQILAGTFVLGYFYFYSTRVDYYSYYFMLIMPWMALMGAYVALDVTRFVSEQMRRDASEMVAAPVSTRPSRADKRRAKRASVEVSKHRGHIWPVVGCGIVLAGVIAFRQSIATDRLEEMGSGMSRYAWRDSPYLGSTLNAALRNLFWTPVSDAIHLPPTISRYLQHETVAAPTIDEFVRAVRAECRPGERIFGEYSLGPFAASVSDCILAANLADTNPHRLKVGESTPEGWVEAIEKDHLAIAIVVPGSAMLQSEPMKQYLLNTFPRVVYTWKDPYVGRVELRRRNS